MSCIFVCPHRANKKGSCYRAFSLLRREGSNLRPPADGYEPDEKLCLVFSSARIVQIKKAPVTEPFPCCEGRDRTSDLRVMSPTSYRCSTSRYNIFYSFCVLFHIYLAVNIFIIIDVRCKIKGIQLPTQIHLIFLKIIFYPLLVTLPPPLADLYFITRLPL